MFKLILKDVQQDLVICCIAEQELNVEIVSVSLYVFVLICQ